MAVMDEFQEERKSLKEQSLKKKIGYFWYYYKWHVIGILLVIVLGGGLIRDMVTNKEYAMFGIFLNAYTNAADLEPFTEEITGVLGVDTSEYTVMFDNSFRMGEEMDESGLNSSQMIMVYTAAKDLDIMTMDTFNFYKYSYNEAYMDLRELFTEEELAQLEGALFYIDLDVVEQVVARNDAMDLETEIPYPDHTDPSQMSNPVPVGINLENAEAFNQYYTYMEEEGFIGVVVNTEHPEYAKKMIQYLFSME